MAVAGKLTGEEYWLIEHGFTSAPTQYRLYGRRFLQVWWPNQQYLYSQTGQVLCMTVPEPGEAMEEELVDKIELNEGFDEVPDPTVSGVDDGSLSIPSTQAAEPPPSTAEDTSSTQHTETAVSQVTCRLTFMYWTVRCLMLITGHA